jgi:thiol-disulfide isomerase/thioredoxin
MARQPGLTPQGRSHMANKNKRKPNSAGARKAKVPGAQTKTAPKVPAPSPEATSSEAELPTAIETKPAQKGVAARSKTGASGQRAARRAAKAREQKRDRILVASVVVVVIVGLVGLALATRSNDVGVTESLAWDLPALEGDVDDDGTDDRFQLASYAGKPLVVNFFASWCTSCEAELPRFVDAADRLGDQLEVVFVNSNETGNWRPMAERTGIIDRALIKDIAGANGNGLYRSLRGTGGMPITAFYDENSSLVHVDYGELSTTALAQRLSSLYGLNV